MRGFSKLSKMCRTMRRGTHSTIDPTRYTPEYRYRRQTRGESGSEQLFCEGVAVEKIADALGTPAYVYSRASIASAYRRLDRALGSLPHTICYAVKANSNLSVLRLLARLGSSFDVVSGGELHRLRRIGVAGERIVFSGVGKTREEIRDALRYRANGRRGGILLFNIESAAELEIFEDEAARLVRAGMPRPSAAIRVNPDIEAGGHRHISTGRREHKFGIEWTEARRLYLAHKNSPWFRWRGISVHIGSQILTVAPFRRAAAQLASHVRELRRAGIALEFADIGGGIGIQYTREKPFASAAYARALARALRPLACRLLVEPGRSLVGPAGVLLTRVLYVKETRGTRFVVVDAAMNDLIRPVLYEATHPVTPASRRIPRQTRWAADIVGPVCETGDFLARGRPLEDVRAGELLVVWGAGAYGFVEASNYNTRRRPPEVLVEGRRFRIIRRRESYAGLLRPEL
ncbi:MAG TPA: diaminopimelate decarboxylase [Candidatus Sulfotelmatobacter sp.]|nr:diaminopimelate decarboxylase [Candidatus Sulfotelmatobacter sp.]